MCVYRLYRADKPSDALQKWRVGRPLGQGALMNPQDKHLPLLTCLGQTAVSFDFLPPMSLSSLDSSENRSDTLTFSGTSTPLPRVTSKNSSPCNFYLPPMASIAFWFLQGKQYIYFLGFLLFDTKKINLNDAAYLIIKINGFIFYLTRVTTAFSAPK